MPKDKKKKVSSKTKMAEAFKLEKLPVFSLGKVMVRDKVRSTHMDEKKKKK